MKPLFALALAALSLPALPAVAADRDAGARVAGLQAFDGAPGAFDVERRGRGRGGRSGADDRRGDDRSGGGHGGRPRVPGGSGCDDPGDVAEHPECRA